MSFLYPRKISIAREKLAENAGEQQEYGGVTPSSEVIIESGVPAHIESERQGTTPTTKLPADAAGQSIWMIVIPKRHAPLGLVKSRDVIIDDRGLRYYVISADWGPLVTSCRAQILEN